MKKSDRIRIARALTAAANALEGSKTVKAYGKNPQVFVGLVLAPALGEWIDIVADEGAMEEAISDAVEAARAEYSRGNPRDYAEEYLFADYDEFPNLGEYASVSDIVKAAELVEQHDPVAVEAAFAEEPDVDDAAELLENGYSVVDDEEEYAYEYVDSMGGVDELGADTVRSYIDFKKLGRDLSYDVNMVSLGGNTYAFHNV